MFHQVSCVLHTKLTVALFRDASLGYRSNFIQSFHHSNVIEPFISQVFTRECYIYLPESQKFDINMFYQSRPLTPHKYKHQALFWFCSSPFLGGNDFQWKKTRALSTAQKKCVRHLATKFRWRIASSTSNSGLQGMSTENVAHKGK